MMARTHQPVHVTDSSTYTAHCVLWTGDVLQALQSLQHETADSFNGLVEDISGGQVTQHTHSTAGHSGAPTAHRRTHALLSQLCVCSRGPWRKRRCYKRHWRRDSRGCRQVWGCLFGCLGGASVRSALIESRCCTRTTAALLPLGMNLSRVWLSQLSEERMQYITLLREYICMVAEWDEKRSGLQQPTRSQRHCSTSCCWRCR